jgi:hypothetical protein
MVVMIGIDVHKGLIVLSRLIRSDVRSAPRPRSGRPTPDIASCCAGLRS